jgi:glycosyltransferase involved in cell wall biosynthesis
MKANSVFDIIMVTYNQEKYVARAIESVLRQRIGLPYRLIIGDDCSTDKTCLICKEYAHKYPDIITVIESNRNLGLVNNYEQCFEASQSKYLAILEGDDYWTCDEKVLKQVEILESDEQIGMVHCNYEMYFEESGLLKKPPRRIFNKCVINQGYIYEVLLRQNFICAMTVMFRSDLIKNIDFTYMIKNNYRTIDYHLWLACSVNNKIRYIKDVVGVYRVSRHSLSNNSNFETRAAFSNTRMTIISYFHAHYPVSNYTIKEINNELNMQLLLRAIISLDIINTIKYIKTFSIRGLYLAILRILDYHCW